MLLLINVHLDLGLDILDGVAGLHLQGDGLPGQGLDEDLHLVWNLLSISVRVYTERVAEKVQNVWLG